MIKWRILSWGDYPIWSGWTLNAITSIVIRGKQRTDLAHTEEKAMWRQRQRWEFHKTKEHRQTPEAGRGKVSLRGSGGNDLDFDPVMLISGFWPPELWENTFFLFWVTKCVMICYSSHRKLIQDATYCRHMSHPSLMDVFPRSPCLNLVPSTATHSTVREFWQSTWFSWSL